MCGGGGVAPIVASPRSYMAVPQHLRQMLKGVPDGHRLLSGPWLPTVRCCVAACRCCSEIIRPRLARLGSLQVWGHLTRITEAGLVFFLVSISAGAGRGWTSLRSETVGVLSVPRCGRQVEEGAGVA